MDPALPSTDVPTAFQLPALLPPPGVQSNFVDPVTRARDLVVTSVIGITLMVICVAIRFYTKLGVKKAWGWDDCKSTY